MAKDLDFKQVKSLIKEYNECFEALIFANNDKNLYNKNIRYLYDITTSSGAFEKVFNAEIEDKNPKYDSNIKELVTAMYKYISLNLAINNSKSYVDKVQNDCGNHIYNLRNVNGLKWLFLSRTRKDEIINSFNHLLDYSNKEDFIEASAFAQIFDEIKRADADTAFEHLNTDSSNYYSIVEYLIKRSKAPQNKPINISVLFKKLGTDDESFKNAAIKYAKRESNIKEAVQKWLTNETLRLLQDISIESASREIKGLRVKNLLENGYTTMADVFAANRYNISAINGISEDTAERLKKLAQDNAQELAKDIKIKINADKKR